MGRTSKNSLACADDASVVASSAAMEKRPGSAAGAGAHNDAYDESHRKSADVGHVRDPRVPAGERLVGVAEDLHDDPEAQDEPCRYDDQGSYDKHPHGVPGMEDKVGPEHASNSARGSDTRNNRCWICVYLSEACSDTCQQVKEQESKVSHLVLNLIPEDEEVHHVADDVHPRGVHEHRGKNRQVNRLWALSLGNCDPMAVDGEVLGCCEVDAAGDLKRDSRIGGHKSLSVG